MLPGFPVAAPRGAAVTADHETAVLSGTVTGASVTETLVASCADLGAGMAAHPWVRSLADGTLPEKALIAWAQQDRLFIIEELRAFLVLRSVAPPGELDDLLAMLISEGQREPGRLAETLAELGAAVTDQAWPTCLGYGSYLRVCALGGLLEGLTALYAAERFYLDTWAAVLPSSPAGSRWRSWVENWSGDEFRAVVTGLGTCLDKLAGPPTAPVLARLQPIYRNVALYGLAFWEMCWAGQGWPEPQVRPLPRCVPDSQDGPRVM